MSIILNKNNEIIQQHSSEEIIQPGHELFVLGETIKLEEGFKVKHLFNILAKYHELIKIHPYIIHFLQNFEDDVEQSDLDAITIKRLIIKYNDKYKGNIENYISVSGLQYNKIESEDNPSGIYSCSFIGLEELREAEIKLEDGVFFEGQHEEKFNTNYTLFELINEIVEEFGFYGLKESRDKEKDKLNNICKEIEQHK
ncbi:MAG: hypothetical protein H8D97_01235 [Proteobacteria bacterium]|nr:hypothetical protein [Pseudomonadota bacterium]